MNALAALIDGLDGLLHAARHLDPSRYHEMLEDIEARDVALRQVAWPEGALAEAAGAVLAGFDGLRAAPGEPDGVAAAFRALRHLPRAEAALYREASALGPVSDYFLEPEQRRNVPGAAGAGGTGISHGGGEPGARGGWSLYVPETYDPSRRHPLVMALHGGSGNGRAFLWSWLRAARSRGAILVAPTALGPTWSLQDPEIDSVRLEALLAELQGRLSIDRERLLLTGMSDGGTFALLSGLADTSPFTHLAPAATGFHPALLEMAELERIAGLPIYLMHGALDWMFDIGRARMVARALAARGAALTWREIEDLPHTYPREENARILAWMERPTAR